MTAYFPGDVLQVKVCDGKEFTGTFAVAGGKYWGVHPEKSPMLEKIVNRMGKDVSHPEYGAKGIASGP